MRNTVLLLLLFLLMGASYYFYKAKAEKGASSGFDKALTIDNTEDIYKIFLAKKTGASFVLDRREDGWYLNEAYKIRPEKIRILLETLKKQRVKYIPTKAGGKHIVEQIAADGIKVETYDKKGNTILNFYVGGNTSDELGTFMIAENSNQPFAIHIPSWEGSLLVRFWDKIDNWRDRTLFNYSSKDIVSLKVDYPRQQSQSFEILKEGEAYTVKPVYSTTPISSKKPNAARIQEYLGKFQSKVAEGYISQYPGRDSVMNLIPFCEVTVKDIDNNVDVTRFYPKEVHSTYENPVKSAQVMAVKGEISRYFVDKNKKDFLVGQQIVLGELFAPYSSFFK